MTKINKQFIYLLKKIEFEKEGLLIIKFAYRNIIGNSNLR